jgi:LPXTG-motif cell wall-anchored protein
MNSEDITKACKVTDTALGFLIETGKALNKGESITVKYEVTFSESFEGGNVKNVAIVSSANTEDAQDDNEVTVTPNPPQKETVTPPAISEDPPTNTKEDDSPGEDFGSPKTGDGFNPVAILILLLGISGIAIALFYRKKTARK